MPTDLAIETYLAIAAICFFSAAISGMAGFGGGIIISIFIAPIVGVKAIIPIMSILMLIVNGSRVVVYREGLDWRFVRIVSLTALPFVALGSYFYVYVDAAVVSCILGVTLILSVPVRRAFAKRKMILGEKALLTVGIPFGFLSGTTIGAGMLLVPVLLGAGLAGPALLATDALIAVLLNVVKMVIFRSSDVLSLDILAAGVVMGLCAIPGTYVAGWIVKRTSIRIHTIIMEVIVIAGGISFIVNFIRRAAQENLL